MGEGGGGSFLVVVVIRFWQFDPGQFNILNFVYFKIIHVKSDITKSRTFGITRLQNTH